MQLSCSASLLSELNLNKQSRHVQDTSSSVSSALTPSLSLSDSSDQDMELSFFTNASKQQSLPSFAEQLLLGKADQAHQPVSISCFSWPKTSLPSLLAQNGYHHVKKISSWQVLCSQRREIPTLEASCMDDIYDALADRLLPTGSVASNPKYKHIVGLAGPPGSGKSTLASEVARRINGLWPQRVSSLDSQVWPPDIATVLPMDGFHLYRHQLDNMENPEEAHARRGAPWTFNPELLISRLRTLRKQGSVYMPSFDHGVGDPVEDDIFVGIQHKVIIVEGNYLLLEEGIWQEAACLFDEKWFIEVDIDTAMQRVLNRHISTGKSPDIAEWRIKYNDRPNAELVNRSKQNADLVIRSINF